VLKDRLTSDQARSDARSFWLLPNGRDLTLQQCLAQAQSVPLAIKVRPKDIKIITIIIIIKIRIASSLILGRVVGLNVAAR
jgi:hypothetical protein